MKFEKFKLSNELLKGLTDLGFKECLPVQSETLVHTLEKKDVCVQSQTGSGKTAAFLITIFQTFVNEKENKNKQALIIVPTRELAVQIEKEAKQIAKYLSFDIQSFYGGVGYDKQLKAINKGVNVIIATPGRLLDLASKKLISLAGIGIFVVDEADRLMDLGFLPDLRKIFKHLKNKNLQTLLFSATLNSNTRSLATTFMKEPVIIDLSTDRLTVENITHFQYHVSTDEKMNLLLGILKKENPNNVLIFTNRKYEAEKLCEKLALNDIDSSFIMGELPQSKRLKLINEFKSGKIKILIATDVASRGLHVEDLDLVINYDLPSNCESYVHRIGRTARVGKKGKAITLTCPDYVFGLEAIESYLEETIPVRIADEEMYLEDKSKGRVHTYSKKRSSRPDRQRSDHSRKNSRHKKSDNGKSWPKPTKKFSRTKKPLSRLAKNSTQNERLEYYKEKYNENFKITEYKLTKNKSTESKSKNEKALNKNKPSLFKRLFKKK